MYFLKDKAGGNKVMLSCINNCILMKDDDKSKFV